MHLWPKRATDPLRQWSTGVRFNAQSEKGAEDFSNPARTSPFSNADISLPLPAVQNAKSKSSFHISHSSYKWNGIRTHWSRFKRHLDLSSSPSTSSILVDESMESNSDIEDDDSFPQENGEVDQIVVDRAWADEESSFSQSEHVIQTQRPETERKVYEVEHVVDASAAVSNKWYPLGTLRWRIWRGLTKFFCTTFSDERLEHFYAEVCCDLPTYFGNQLRRNKGKVAPQKIVGNLGFTVAGYELGPWGYFRSQTTDYLSTGQNL